MNCGDLFMGIETLAAIGMGISGVASIAGGIMQQQQSRAQAKEVLNTAARQAQYNADAASAQATAKAKQIKALAGKQATQYAAAGIDVSGGTPLDVMRETYTLGMEDIQELTNYTNIQNQELMYGAKSKANQLVSQGRAAMFGGIASGLGSLGGAYSIYNSGITNVTGTAKTGGNVTITNAKYTG